MPTILQISDAHLSPRNGLFRANLERLRQIALETKPDLVVATGDLSLDGADSEADLDFAAALHEAFPAPLLALPGNHDIGSHARTMPRQRVNTALLLRWQARLGLGRGVVDLPGWRIVGLNSEVMGAGLDEEAVQAAFVAEVAADAGERRIALFLHKPVFVTTPDDPTFDYRSVPPASRQVLAPLMDHPGLRLIASGHLHLHRQFNLGAVRYAWAPPVSFIVNPAEQAGLPGKRCCGALLHSLLPDAVETELLVPHGMEVSLLDDIRPLTYPRAAA